MTRGTSFIGITTIALLLIAPVAMASKHGDIKHLFPPGNQGAAYGSGQIEEINDDGIGLGQPYFMFRTPQDVAADSGPLQVGDLVTFDNPKGRKATNVTNVFDPAGVLGGDGADSSSGDFWFDFVRVFFGDYTAVVEIIDRTW